MQTQHEDLWQITNQSYSVGWKLDISNSSPWGHHWRRPVYGGRQYLEMGRAIRIVGLYHRRAIRLFHHAFNGRNVVPRTGYRFVRRLCASLYEPVLWLSHRLVLLVYVDGGGDLRNHRHWRLCPVLVPGDGAVDTRIDRSGAGGVGESGGGAVVRRNRSSGSR